MAGSTTCGHHPSAAVPPPPDGLVNAQRLARRLEALKLALDDLPRQARRLVRWRLRREKVHAEVPLTAPSRPSARLTAGNRLTKSMRSSSNAMGSPGKP